MPTPYLCLYAASSRVLSPHLYSMGFEFGRRAASAGWGLVFGGANIGIMDAVARGFKAEQAPVISVIPRVFDRRGLTFTDADEVHITDDLRERKRIMLGLSRAFVVFPGGPGTLDEFFETLTLKQLGFHAMPIVLVNIDGHFEGTIRQVEAMVRGGYASTHLQELFTVASDVEAALDALGSPVEHPSG